MKLSPNFSFLELTVTSHESLQKSNRISAESFTKQLKYTAGALEEVRELLGVPLTVTSGFRMPILNKAVGGSATSKHTVGLCADVIPVGMAVNEAFAKITANKDKLGSVRKVIIEGIKGKSWLHIQSKVLASEPTELFSTTDGKNYTKVGV
jgi:hypothetical protein